MIYPCDMKVGKRTGVRQVIKNISHTLHHGETKTYHLKY